MMRRLLLVLLLAMSAILFAPLVANAATQSDSAGRSASWAGNAALNWAETQTGAWYHWGGVGPYYDGYDCSGLVYAAFEHIGIDIPRDTYEMLASGHLRQVSTPRRGDLAFYGSGHVEFVTVWGPWVTFGAQDTGTQVGWHHASVWWHPTMYFEVVT